MKKLLVLLRILLMICGCSRQDKKAATAAILTNSENDSAVLVVYDENDTEIFHHEIEYPSEVYFGDDAVYYSANHTDYQSVDLATHKAGDTLNGVSGTIIYHHKGHDTYTYSGINVTVYDDEGKQLNKLQDVLMVNHVGGCFYVTRGDRSGDIYSETGNAQLGHIDSVNSTYMSFTEVDGKVYMVTDNGFTLIENGQLLDTYVYQLPVEGINMVKDDIISCYVDKELKRYKVSFEGYGMKMNELSESRIYDDAYFEKMYREYYSKGYIVEFFNEYMVER